MTESFIRMQTGRIQGKPKGNHPHLLMWETAHCPSNLWNDGIYDAMLVLQVPWDSASNKIYHISFVHIIVGIREGGP
jgi:hypothetical protein